MCMPISPFVSGQWRVFSGNELGALLGWWMFRCWKQQNSDTAAVKNLYMLSSTVSSKILRAIALKEGFHFEVTVKVKTVNIQYHLLIVLGSVFIFHNENTFYFIYYFN